MGSRNPAKIEVMIQPARLPAEPGQRAAIEQLSYRPCRIRRKLAVDMQKTVPGKDAPVHPRFEHRNGPPIMLLHESLHVMNRHIDVDGNGIPFHHFRDRASLWRASQ